MSETKFTPGPWHWVDHGSFINIESKDCSSIASLFSYATPEIEEPNAHLIAAAPTMYEVLDWLDSRGGLGLEVHAVISTALAQARGEA
jgi:hypothetical protein